MLPLSVKQPCCHGANLGEIWPGRANAVGSQHGRSPRDARSPRCLRHCYSKISNRFLDLGENDAVIRICQRETGFDFREVDDRIGA